MAETQNQELKTDKLTGQEYDKSNAPLISKKGILLVAGMFVVYTGVLVALSVMTGGGSTAAKESDATASDASGEGGPGNALPDIDRLYKMGKAIATVPVANTTKMATVGAVLVTIDEEKAPGLTEMLAGDRADDVKQRVLLVVEDTLRSYAYEHLRQPGMKEKLQAILPDKINKELGLKEGAIQKVYLRDFRLPK